MKKEETQSQSLMYPVSAAALHLCWLVHIGVLVTVGRFTLLVLQGVPQGMMHYGGLPPQ